MTIEQERLFNLIEFAQKSALLKAGTVNDVGRYENYFLLYEHEISDLPGLHFDVAKEDNEIWLMLERLQESAAPKPESVLLTVWLELTNNPAKEPTLKSQVPAETLISIGVLPIAAPAEEESTELTQSVSLELFEQRELVEKQFAAYIETIWKPWAIEEKRRRRTISLYAKFFSLKQQLEGSLVEAQLEFVWGVGVAVWNMDGIKVNFPLITRLVELSLDEKTGNIKIHPRDVDPKIELDIFTEANNPNVHSLEIQAKSFFDQAETTFSPFQRSSYEPLLQSAKTYLDPAGIFWPSQTTAEDRSLPPPSEELKVTDTWVLFARPRSASLFVQDLERFKEKLATQELPNAVAALVTDPSTTNPEIILPAFRGVSLIGGGENTDAGKTAQDLFFPKPFNDEQVRIVQLLECYDGVVVQGPPGTGKTHTIANVICHYLALGKRVLVTSMKDPALGVLREKLPEPIQPLAISLLSSEQEGMKQFQSAISTIATGVQNIDRSRLLRDIAQLESEIDRYHAQLAQIDRQIDAWAKKNLGKIDLDGELLEPLTAAHEVVASFSEIAWLDDALSVGSEYCPQFTDNDVARLREARRQLGHDLDYLTCTLPQAAFPDSQEILQAHQDLIRLGALEKQVQEGDVPALVDSSKATLEAAHNLASKLSNLQRLRKSLQNAGHQWTSAVLELLRKQEQQEVFQLLNSLVEELLQTENERRRFKERPVSVPEDIDRNQILVKALANLAEGKQPFGLKGIVGKSQEKDTLKSIRVLADTPAGKEDWRHVFDFVCLIKHQRGLIIRWNALAADLPLPEFSVEPAQANAMADAYTIYKKLVQFVELEAVIIAELRHLLPSWSEATKILEDESFIEEAERILLHHLTQHGLASTWVIKENCQRVFSGCTGRVCDEIRHFIDGELGNTALSVGDMQVQLTKLMEELRRVQALKPFLATVEEITGLITDSGAPRWAERLRTEPAAELTGDALLPANWRQAWRLCRLANYLKTLDGRMELKSLADQRLAVETKLAEVYQESVTQRTWLKLKEKTTHSVSAALEAFRLAIARIGRGTGLRATRYRQDARNAASKANPAIPCWIMPHYRVSESLPPDLGCFDLVVVDEASQSDLTALPAILRAQKLLVVGDDLQVSPDGIGEKEDKIRELRERFLVNQVDTYGPLMTPERSIYDLFQTVFSTSRVKLQEHFRCVAPIIEYSKREFYKHELKPLRLPKASERLDPPLVDVYVEDGYRKNGQKINLAEARFIVEEIKVIVSDPLMSKRSIGVVSLLGNEQAQTIWQMLEEEIGLEAIERHRITCGDARTFQGKERDIIFLSLVASRDECTALSGRAYEQRFNVAASRAKDRMYLVRSIGGDDLSPKDILRKNLLAHFQSPFAQDESRVETLRDLCESDFEREIYDLLTGRGYRVIPQVKFGGKSGVMAEYRIDMVVEGNNDNRLAIECDGDRFHGPDRWEDDMRRQRTLERAGWRFWRCFASAFVMNRNEVVDDLLNALGDLRIEPIGVNGSGPSLYVESRKYTAFPSDDGVEIPDVTQTELPCEFAE
ncbi:MAG: AAA domain-containing protein [Methylomicrobium sp.]